MSLFLVLIACRQDVAKPDEFYDSGTIVNHDSATVDRDSGTGVDNDGDGFPASEDCNDSDAAINSDAVELCDGVDNDCDGLVDEDVLQLYYADTDGDGYGDDATATELCESPSNMVEQGGDCDDSDLNIHPDAIELCDGMDNDCDGLLDTANECPCNVELYGSHTYLYCETVSNWYEASSACQSLPNFELVVVNDASEQAWIWNISSAYAVNGWWWLGYHNQSATAAQEPAGLWEWVGGQTSSYSAPWYPHDPWPQPDDYQGNEDCAHIDSSHGFWNDMDCSRDDWDGTSIYYICESVLP